jgi:hypothetical protein
MNLVIIISLCSGSFLSHAALSKLPSRTQADRATGLSIRQLREFASTIPALPGTIQAIQFLRDKALHINRAAVLTEGENTGWQVFVLHLEKTGKSKLEWKSGELADSFAVSSADQFQTYFLSGQEVLRFSGCAAHICADVFSVMLFAIRERRLHGNVHVGEGHLFSCRRWVQIPVLQDGSRPVHCQAPQRLSPAQHGRSGLQPRPSFDADFKELDGRGTDQKDLGALRRRSGRRQFFETSRSAAKVALKRRCSSRSCSITTGQRRRRCRQPRQIAISPCKSCTKPSEK